MPSKIPVSSGKKRLFIHAGTYKTGTSHFQHVMYANKEKLREAGILYPTMGLGINTPHNKYAHRIAAFNLTNHGKNIYPDIVKQLTDDDDLHTGYLSYEGYSNPNHIRHLAKVIDSFAPVELHVILVFRPHVDFQMSLYREVCQHILYSRDIKAFLQKESGWATTFGFADIIRTWEALVGRDQLHIFSFNDVKDDLLGNLLSPIGHAPDALKKPAWASRNPTISAPAASVARRLNRYKLPGLLRHRAGRLLVQLDEQNLHFHNYCEITQDQAVEIENTYSNDRAGLASYGLHPDDFLLGDKWRWGTKLLEPRIEDEALIKFVNLLHVEKRYKILEAITKHST